MSTPLRIEIADDARAQIAAATAWWATNRPSAPSAIQEDLDRILGLLSVQPESGMPSNVYPGMHLKPPPEIDAALTREARRIDDVGTVDNPLTLKGQIHCGVVQGLSQVLSGRIAYDPGSGQLLTGSFMDYCLPRADDVCAMEVGINPVPTSLNPLGVKGARGGGNGRRLADGDERIMDALAALGVKEFDMPATGDRVWRAICKARSA